MTLRFTRFKQHDISQSWVLTPLTPAGTSISREDVSKTGRPGASTSLARQPTIHQQFAEVGRERENRS
jgi:hypothetical protein